MTLALPLALAMPGTDQIGQTVLRILAVAGAAAVGGLLIGLITQGLSRMLTTRPVPRMPLNIIRVLGAIVCGWVAYLLLIGGSGGSGGWGGLWPFGSGGGGTGSGKEPPPASTAPAGGTGRDTGPRQTARSEPGHGHTLLIEVLPEFPAVYRIQTPDGPRRFSFDELKTYLLEQKKAAPPLAGIQVSEESSDPQAPAVIRLTGWARDNGFTIVKPPKGSP